MINENNMLKTLQNHTILAIGFICFMAIITVLVGVKCMKNYNNACQSTFIYYKNGSSVLVSNRQISTKKNKANGRVKGIE
jgi:hypothetical protein